MSGPRLHLWVLFNPIKLHLFIPQMFLVDKTDVSWWSMKTAEGKQGLVPVNYIDKLDTPVNVASPSNRASSPTMMSSPNRPASPNRVSFPNNLPSPNRVAFTNTAKMPYHNRPSSPTRASSPNRVPPHVSPPSHQKLQSSIDSSVISVGSNSNPISSGSPPAPIVDEVRDMHVHVVSMHVHVVHAGIYMIVVVM